MANLDFSTLNEEQNMKLATPFTGRQCSFSDPDCDHWIYVPSPDVDTPHWGPMLDQTDTASEVSSLRAIVEPDQIGGV